MPILQWLDRDKDVKAAEKVPYRLLEAVPKLSCGDEDSQNMLIQGDNLEALKALLPYYAGQVKCIFIDPPYNTRSAFEHYDDNLEHSKWLSMMYPRLELLRELLAEDGSIWVTLDDSEAHYLKVIMDEVFGRKNFLGAVAWEKADSPRMDAVYYSYRHDNILSYSKNKEQVLFRRLAVSEEDIPDHYNRTDEAGRRYYTKPLRAMGGQGETREARPTLYYSLTAPDGKSVYPKLQDGRDGAWRWSKEKVVEDRDRIEWVDGRNGWVPYYRIYADNIKARPLETIWFNDEVGTNRTSKAEIKALDLSEKSFSTPKPEKLIERILHVSTEEEDLVLDSFLGSGTTSAVAHKMGRRHIGVELGEHAMSHCQPRLQKVVDGEQGGISKDVGWQGGGGFKFYRLGNAIFDAEGQINESIKFEHLAAHIWFYETKTPVKKKPRTPLLGVHNGTAYYLLYNGILGDKSVNGGNVLTSKILESLPKHEGPKVIYGESSRLGAVRLSREGITFKQTPYDVKAR